MSANGEKVWVLRYWGKIPGRGEFIRLIFEEAGVPYENSDENLVEYFRKGACRFGELEMFPSYAAPVIERDGFTLSQTPVICRYLGQKYWLYPESETDQWRAEQFNVTLHDFIAEGRLAFHGIHPNASYFTQQKETQPYIDRFLVERLPKYLMHFKAVLMRNNDSKGFLFGDRLTYVDLALLHVLRATEFQFPEAWKSAVKEFAKPLDDFKNRISARPNLAAYFKSDRCLPFEGNSMM